MARVISDLEVRDWGVEKIDLGEGPYLISVITGLHHKADGAMGGASFAFDMTDGATGAVKIVSEVSLAMLQRAFAKLGYQLVDRRNVQ